MLTENSKIKNATNSQTFCHVTIDFMTTLISRLRVRSEARPLESFMITGNNRTAQIVHAIISYELHTYTTTLLIYGGPFFDTDLSSKIPFFQKSLFDS